MSPVEEMKKSIGVIQDNDADIDDKLTAFDTLVEWCEHIDFAIGKYFGFFHCFLLLLWLHGKHCFTAH